MIFYTVDLDENNNRIKGTGRLLGKTSDEGSFYPEGCFVETYLRITNTEKELTPKIVYKKNSVKVADGVYIIANELFK